MRKALPLSPGVKTDLGAERRVGFHDAGGRRPSASAGSWPGSQPQAELGAGPGQEGVGGDVNGGGVEADDRQRRFGPHAARRSCRCRRAGRRRAPRHRRGIPLRGRSTVASSRLTRPAIATLPSSSWRVAIRRDSRVGASSTGPPNMPECTAWSRTLTSMVPSTRPRRLVVSAGMPTFQLLESATTITSARSSSRWVSRKVRKRRGAGFLLALEEERDAEAEVLAQHAGHGRVGGDVGHDAGLVVGGAAAVEPPVALDGGRTARCPTAPVAGGLHVVVRVQQDRRLAVARRDGVRRRRGRPGVPSSLSQRRIWTSSKPPARTSCATASALAFSGAGSKLGQAMPGMATSSFNWAIVVSNDSVTAWRSASVSTFPVRPVAVCGFPAGDEVMARTLPVSRITPNLNA